MKRLPDLPRPLQYAHREKQGAVVRLVLMNLPLWFFDRKPT